MKKSLIFAMAMALGVTASAYAANPFSDVPAGHWAYDSIEKLAAAGVIDGYGDGTFGGDKLMTRYEMAQIVARAMANGANVDKLAAEFADELDALGVRVANLEKKADAVKIAGEIRAHYADYRGKSSRGIHYESSGSVLRTRLWFKGQVNDNWTYVGMVQNQQDFRNNTGDERLDFQRAYIEGKLGDVEVQAGRIDTTDITGGNIYDTRFDGIKLTYGKEVKLIGRAGKPTDQYREAADYDDAYSLEAVAELGKAVDIHAGWWGFKGKDGTEDDDIWLAGVNVDLLKDLQLTADYLKSSESDPDIDNFGYVIGLNYRGASANKPGSWGLHAKYYYEPATVVIAHTMNGDYNNGWGFKGYSLMGYYTIAKNMVGGVEWYDLKSMIGGKDKTLWTQLVLSF